MNKQIQLSKTKKKKIQLLVTNLPYPIWKYQMHKGIFLSAPRSRLSQLIVFKKNLKALFPWFLIEGNLKKSVSSFVWNFVRGDNTE